MLRWNSPQVEELRSILIVLPSVFGFGLAHLKVGRIGLANAFEVVLRVSGRAPRVGKSGNSAAPLFFFFFTIPAYYPRTIILSRSLQVAAEIRGHIAGSPPPSPIRTVRAYIFIARRIQHFLPSSTRLEMYLPTLLGALSSGILFIFLHFCK